MKRFTSFLAAITAIFGALLIFGGLAGAVGLIMQGPSAGDAILLSILIVWVIVLGAVFLITGLGYCKNRSARRAGSVSTACGFIGWLLLQRAVTARLEPLVRPEFMLGATLLTILVSVWATRRLTRVLEGAHATA